MSKAAWYWHRLRAMSPGEMARHARKKWRQIADAKRVAWPEVDLRGSGAFPHLPKPEDAPAELREALRRDVEEILAGRWKFFGHLELQVDDSPKWQYDYLVRRDVETTGSAFKLNYRSLTEGVDSKVIWEPSRWYQPVRLAMAAYVLGDARAAAKCLDWLEDWVAHNPPYRGWNWTSALEVGIRLVQFTWIDGLLGELRFTNDDLRAGESRNVSLVNRKSEIVNPSAASWSERLARLRRAILPAHVWYAWRHQSFGSSANNHLLGELAGCILAVARWPGLAAVAAPVEVLQERWEREVLAQFAEDGGNKEQALNYQLFSWEFCWQTQIALRAAGRSLSPAAEERLRRAARFFWEVQVRHEPWDYGDSDNAFVTLFGTSESLALLEWRDWFSRGPCESPLRYWLGNPPVFEPSLGRGAPSWTTNAKSWWLYARSGVALCESGFWWLRWDLSPLGYLATAAHGHLDALHLSIWLKGVALVIDPGTGAYHADRLLRTWLASRQAHNGPCPVGSDFPRRLGPFLWREHHAVPQTRTDGNKLVGELHEPSGILRRAVEHSAHGLQWRVEDAFTRRTGEAGAFTVRWQFPPGAWVKRLSERKFSVHRADVSVMIEVDSAWATVELFEPDTKAPSEEPFAGVVSPAFRRVEHAPFLKLTAPAGGQPCVFATTFLASAP